jgi:hypothetical protein
MVRLRRRIGDPKVCRLVVAFLKAGVMSDPTLKRQGRFRAHTDPGIG